MKKVLVFIDQEYADWEQGFVCPQLRQYGYEIETISSKDEFITSMSGFITKTNHTLDEKIESDYDALILIGGMNWRKCDYQNEKLKCLVSRFVNENKLVGAICDATTFMGYNGFFDNVLHTGNTVQYLLAKCPEYKGKDYYLSKQCVSSNNIISANGSASLEFTREVLKALKVTNDSEIDQWYGFMKKGYFQD